MVVLPEPSLLLPKLSVWLDPTVSTVISGSLKSCERCQLVIQMMVKSTVYNDIREAHRQLLRGAHGGGRVLPLHGEIWILCDKRHFETLQTHADITALRLKSHGFLHRFRAQIGANLRKYGTVRVVVASGDLGGLLGGGEVHFRRFTDGLFFPQTRLLLVQLSLCGHALFR